MVNGMPSQISAPGLIIPPNFLISSFSIDTMTKFGTLTFIYCATAVKYCVSNKMLLKILIMLSRLNLSKMMI